MRAHKGHNQRGSSLIETVVSLTILAALGGGMFSAVLDSDGVFRKSLRTTHVRNHALRGLEPVRDDLLQANPDTLVIDRANNPNSHVVCLQVPLRVNNGVVVWGATRIKAGIRQEFVGHTVNYLLMPQPTGGFQLVRRILDPNGVPVGGNQVLAKDVDGPTDDGKGFEVWEDDFLRSIQLRFRVGDGIDPDTGQPTGEEVVRTHRTTVLLRNR